MGIVMNHMPVKNIFLDRRLEETDGSYEFTIDCGSVYFGAVYDQAGDLLFIDQYFYSDDYSREDLSDAIIHKDLLSVEQSDFPVKAYLLTRSWGEQEWLHFHAVVSQNINPNYFETKYIGD